jgi:protein O-mannosyl-transferase
LIMTAPSDKPTDRRFGMIAIILITMTVIIMGRLCLNDFTWWDDDRTVHQNPFMNPPTLETIQHYCLHSENRIYTPPTYMIWAVLALMSRIPPDADGIALNPFLFHSANVLLHGLAVVVVCRILLLLEVKRFASICGALVFAIHPIQVEAVAWVSGLKDVLSGLLVLIALWQYCRYAIDAKEGRQRIAPLMLCIFCFIVAMFAKASAATMPLAAIAIDRWIIGRPWKSVLPLPILLMIAAIPFIIMSSIEQGEGDLPLVHLCQRPLIACDSLAFYLRKLVWPTNLCIDYGRTPTVALREKWIGGSCLMAVTIIIALILLPKRVSVLRAGSLVFLAGALPTLGLTGFIMQFYSTTADHYLYWAMLGPAIAIGWALTAYATSPAIRVGVVGVIALLGVLSFRQGAVWKDDFSLNRHAVEVNPNSFLGYNNLGNAYHRQRQSLLASDMFRCAIAVKPDFPIAHSNLAATLHDLDELDGATAELRQSIALQRARPARLRQTWTTDLNRLGQILMECGNPSQAVAPLRESLAAQPDQAQTAQLLRLAINDSLRPTTAGAQATPSKANP